MDTFADLPDALVRDLLAKAVPVAERVSVNLAAMRQARAGLRSQAESHGLIRRKMDMDVPREPSVAGVDGSYQIHRLTAVDLCATAAVAVEGTSKEARRYWPNLATRCGSIQYPTTQTSSGFFEGRWSAWSWTLRVKLRTT